MGVDFARFDLAEMVEQELAKRREELDLKQRLAVLAAADKGCVVSAGTPAWALFDAIRQAYRGNVRG